MLLFSVLLILRTAVGGGFRPAVRACCLRALLHWRAETAANRRI